MLHLEEKITPTKVQPHQRSEHPDDSLASLCHKFIKDIGEDPTREGLVKTPERFTKAMREVTAGYNTNVAELVNEAIFEDHSSEIVVVKDIEFYSLCEHHLLPFFGKANIAYIPNGKIIGLSKIPRIVQMYAQRLQVQERLTKEIADQLQQILQPKGVICRIESTHLCMMMRGVKSSSSSMVTQSTLGSFRTDKELRDEFSQLANLSSDEST
ncbi:UNVERIFIED_CONTAM: hypothetical protein GTU68_005637 [Idotea baltica]|nr:hypothetical protein [Idotea baltica]